MFRGKSSDIELRITISSFLKARPAKTPIPAVWNQGANLMEKNSQGIDTGAYCKRIVQTVQIHLQANIADTTK